MNRIRELLQEEQNFEIINYPTPPQYSTSKIGHKKVIKKEVSMVAVKQVVFLALANFRMKAMHHTIQIVTCFSFLVFRGVSWKWRKVYMQ